MKILAMQQASDLFLTDTGEGRKPGVHLSDILSRMAWEREKKYHPDAPKDLMMFEAGHTWETVLARGLSERHGKRAGFRPEQIQEDGIWLSPDWLNPKGDIQVEEWKSTRKSIKSAEEKIKEWGPQVMSYLRAMVRRGYAATLAVRFRTWFVMGDWSFENKGDLTLLKDYYTIDVEYDKRELEENWRAIVAAGRKYGLLKAPPNDLRAAQHSEAKQSPAAHSKAQHPASKKESWQPKRKSDSNKPLKSPARVLRGTFPNTNRSSRPRSGS